MKLKAQLPLIGLMALAFLIFPNPSIARGGRNKYCGSSNCGNLTINYPFRLKTQPTDCGDPRFELECDDVTNRTILVIDRDKFHVEDISYSAYSIQILDASLATDTDNCSIPLTSYRFIGGPCSAIPYMFDPIRYDIMYVVNCTTPMESRLYVDAPRCQNYNSSRAPPTYLYFLDENTAPRDFNQSCTIVARVPIMNVTVSGLSTSDIYEKLSMGVELSWEQHNVRCGDQKFDLFSSLRYGLVIYLESFIHYLFKGPHLASDTVNTPNNAYILSLQLTGGILIPRTLLGILCLIALVTYKWRRRHLSADDIIEEFLQSQKNLMPIRYSYREIKRITRGFKDKLGEGGYGLVFKGKLRSNHLVAVKVLGKSKANGQDFISEVSTIGRIHHVNVAKLIGFCVEGSKQALVYDFMPNGSLDKIIFSGDNNTTLSWKRIYDVVLGVARGIDYLHQGCDSQILHFDIKPHNILLDENFVPKVSDFGLARLYSVDESTISLTAARGTLGYIAPELMYKNLGGISYKADVYSFGMLLMEMVGKRKNLNESVEHSSQIYFPSWIYARLYQGGSMDLGDVTLTGTENIIVRKILIVAFWCIQMKPTDRPSMSKVLEMLESDDVVLLEMPPKPFQLLLVESSRSDDIENPFDEPTRSFDTNVY